jgi:hypothetical protein
VLEAFGIIGSSGQQQFNFGVGADDDLEETGNDSEINNSQGKDSANGGNDSDDD